MSHYPLDSSSPYDSPLFAVLNVHANILHSAIAGVPPPRLPIVLVEELQHVSGANVRQLCQMLHIPQGSFYGLKRQNSLLTPAQSLRLLRIAQLLHRCYDLFGERDSVLQWLKQPEWDLDGHSPWELLATERGLDEVAALLDRLQRGGRTLFPTI